MFIYRHKLNYNVKTIVSLPINLFCISMGKTMCKLSKKERAEKQEGELKFQCKECGEKARKEKHLCEPKKI